MTAAGPLLFPANSHYARNNGAAPAVLQVHPPEEARMAIDRRQFLKLSALGGGAVLANMTSMNVGERNGAFVLKFLATERIRVAAQDLLGVWPRKIYYFPHSGRVLVKKLREMHNDTILARERDYGKRIEREPVAGDVELFS